MFSVDNNKNVFFYVCDQSEHEDLKQQQINCGEYFVTKHFRIFWLIICYLEK
jgi:hypothetical protein